MTKDQALKLVGELARASAQRCIAANGSLKTYELEAKAALEIVRHLTDSPVSKAEIEEAIQ